MTARFTSSTNAGVRKEGFVDNSSTSASGTAFSQGPGYSVLNISRDGVHRQAASHEGSGFVGSFNQNRAFHGYLNAYDANKHGLSTQSNTFGDNNSTRSNVAVLANGQNNVIGNASNNGVMVMLLVLNAPMLAVTGLITKTLMAA